MRTPAALFLVFGLVTALSACSAAGDDPKDSDEVGPNACIASSGEASDAVTAEGKLGDTPKVTFDFPIEATETERTVSIEGDGDAVATGDLISVSLATFNATTGEEIPSGNEDGEAAELMVSPDAVLIGLVKALQCTPAGSRVVAVIPPEDLWGDEGYPTLGMSGTDSMVLLADVVEILPPPEPAAPPEPVETPDTTPWSENIPQVSFDGDLPTVTIPEGDAPAELQLAVLKEGDGDVVAATDTVTIDYQGTSWQTGEVFDQSYGKAPLSAPANGLVPGFTAALIGQKVGAQLLVTIPPVYAYGENPEGHQLGGQTLVFLIDIKSID